ncbi:hypothetical protein IPL68_04550 [Candidatus Saccharibacteria bacterium]|nr:MAG: hypothetical protein IPL68_04550 [Candidatus Saccharibacteria bacterium]
MAKPATCGGTSYGLWCVDSTNKINGANGLGAAGATVFNNVIYVAGGTDSTNWQSTLWRVGLNANGSLAGAWSTQAFGTGAGNLGLTGNDADARGYFYMFTRANPNAANSNPGNLYILGGCAGSSGIGCNTYYTETIKCNIDTSGVVNTCGTGSQLQIDADNITSGDQGLGLMAGTVYANRLYLVGGSCTSVGAAGNPCGSTYSANRKDTIYAKIDSSNNIVAESGGVWQFASAQMNPVRRRAMSFGYNGYIYSLAGFSGSSSLQDLLFSKIDVSTGDMEPWSSSGVVVTPRWDLRAIVSNGYVYAIGGCGLGNGSQPEAPSNCLTMQPEIQTFQLYNNDSGTPMAYSATGTCGAGPCSGAGGVDRVGGSSTILNGYIYYTGGCTNTGCTTMSNLTYYAPIDSNGGVGTWVQAASTLPTALAWGKLLAAGGALYYIGGQTGAAATTAVSTVYYTSGIASGVPTWNASAASGGVGDTAGQVAQPRTQFGAAAWNNRLYVVGGYSSGGTVQSTVYVSPQLSSGGNISADSWASSTAFSVARAGLAAVAYANNLYLFGGEETAGNYLNDSQFTRINSDGTVDAWTYSTSLPGRLRDAEGYAANGYLYLLGGRSASTTCVPNTLVTPISANTTIASGNNPTGVGEWYETNKKYTGDRYGAAVAYANGRAYIMGGACNSAFGGR